MDVPTDIDCGWIECADNVEIDYRWAVRDLLTPLRYAPVEEVIIRAKIGRLWV